MHKAELWKWIVLSLGLEPSLIGIDNTAHELGVASGPEFTGLPQSVWPDFRDRLEVALSAVGLESPLRPADPSYGMSVDHEMRVVIERAVFVNWARGLKWSLPSQLEHSSPRPPNWEKWQHMFKAPLWEWIALSLGLEPAEIDTLIPDFIGLIPPVVRFEGVPDAVKPRFLDRLDVAISHLDYGADLRPANSNGMLKAPPLVVVEREVFARWARTVQWEVPGALAPPSDKAPAAGATGERVEGWDNILEALRPLVGNLSEREARRRLGDAGVEIHREGGVAWISRNELSKLKTK